MRVKVSPSLCHGTIQIPPSKSMAHRAIICASLANGTSHLSNVNYSDDILATIRCMRQLGAIIQENDDMLTITGISQFPKELKEPLHCGESGSTLRFLIPICSLCKAQVSFQGEGRLLQRPQTIYQQIFQKQNLCFHQTSDTIHIQGPLQATTYTINGNISSQFISGLLFTLPLLSQDSIIRILPPFASKSYVDLTIFMLKQFGVTVYFSDAYTIHVPGNQKYQPSTYSIEADYSQFAFFAVLAAIQGDMTLTGVNHDSLQGDKQILEILERFGAKVSPVKHGYRIMHHRLIACDVDLENCPDLGPILSVLAAYANGTTKFYHANRLRIKESDRIQAIEDELRKFRIITSSTQDELYVTGTDNMQCHEVLFGHYDHRIVMAMTIAALSSKTPCIIDGAEAITKSYPNFFHDIESIHGHIEYLDEEKL